MALSMCISNIDKKKQMKSQDQSTVFNDGTPQTEGYLDQITGPQSSPGCFVLLLVQCSSFSRIDVSQP